MISLSDVTYAYPDQPRPALSAVDWSVEAGAFVLVTGPSGSGKSTLLRCLNGLVPHFAGGRFGGRITVAGRDPVALGPAGMSASVGFVFQNPEAQAVLPVVEEEIAFGLEQRGLPLAIMRRRVEEVLDLLGIAALRRRELSTLSGGERQRVALAAVLVNQPTVLVLDEPTSQLDPHGAEAVLAALERLNSDLGLTIVLAEHRLERVVGLADRLVWLAGQGAAPWDAPLRAGLARLPLLPPLLELARRWDWQPWPLTIRAGRRFAATVQPPPLPPLTSRPRSAGPALVLRGLHFAYERRPILTDLNLRVEPGELVALMGRNGSGKTTLLRLIMGLLRPTRGQIALGGQPSARLTTAEIGRLVGYVPQEPGRLLAARTVRAELALGQRQPGDAGRSAALLERLGLSELAERYPRDLSVGEQQRVALATALVGEPRLLLLDEPTRGLDAGAKLMLGEQLNQLRAEGLAIMLVTHDVELVARWADRVVLLGDGEVVADDTPRAVLAGSLTFAPQINRLFGGEYLTLAEVIDHA